LIVAASNGEDDTVQVVQGSYVGNFVYSSTESYDVIIEGGYTGNCTSQVIDPANTILDGDQASSVLVLASNNESNFTVQGLSLQNGDASSGGEGDKGAGLYVKTAVGNVSVSNCAITGNTANSYGGGVYVYNSDTATMTNNTITGNTANSYGGGVYVSSDTVTMTNNTIIGNTSTYHGGGGVYVYNSNTATMTNNTITGNTANSGGGGVYVYNSDTATMTNNTITGNTANGGGGVYVYNSDTATMTNNTITGNTANNHGGGGVYVYNSDTATMTNNTITGNTANNHDGGGVYVYSNSSSIQHVVTLTNNTITGNSADNGGGLYLKLQQETGYTYIYNNIIWSNIAITQGADIYINNDGDNDYLASHVDIYNNDFDQSSTGFYIVIPIIIDSSNLDNQDPLFRDIHCHLNTVSPCIDAGENNAPGLPATDMDGDNRIINGIVDIGADECSEISVGNVAINNVWKSVNEPTSRRISPTWSFQVAVTRWPMEASGKQVCSPCQAQVPGPPMPLLTHSLLPRPCS
jgi:parallel beta-helix repeat protein